MTFVLSGTGIGRSPWSPSIDRIDSSRGYTRDNVQLVCLSYNLAKSNFTDDDVLQMAKGMIMHTYPSADAA